jgi:predicted transcriptional regulator
LHNNIASDDWKSDLEQWQQENQLQAHLQEITPLSIIPIAAVDHARKLQAAEINVVPLNPKNNQIYDVTNRDYADKYPDEQMDKLFEGQNLGVRLGSKSNGLFVIICSTIKAYKELQSTFGTEYPLWVSTNEKGKYVFWFRSKNGYIRSCYSRYKKIKFRIEGIQSAPPSIFENGICCKWVVKKGDFPPIISNLELKEIFGNYRYFHITTSEPHIYSPGVVRPLRSAYLRYLVSHWIYEYPWISRTMITDQAVFSACCIRADLEHDDNFRATAREIAELANVTKNTAAKSLKRLCKLGLLIIIAKDVDGSHYAITVDISNYAHQKYPYNKYAINMATLQSCDAFSRGGLNKSAAKVYDLLIKEPQRTKVDIKRKTRLSYPTVTSALNKLIENKAVYKENKYWHACRDLNILDEIAEKRNTRGKLERKKEVHRRERRKYAAWLTHVAIERERRKSI